MRRLDAALDEVFGRGDVEGSLAGNLVFHRRLYGVAPDDALLPLIDSVWLQIGSFMRAALAEADIREEIGWLPDRRDGSV